MRRYEFIFQFLPLSAFVTFARAKGFSPEAWGVGFQIGGLLAVVQTLVFAARRIPLNRLLLSVNLYLIVGGLGSSLNIDYLWNMYGRLREAALFICVFVVGLAGTVFTGSAFFTLDNENPSATHKYSVYALVVAAISVVISLMFRGNVWLAGMLPFVLLLVALKGLQAKVRNLSSLRIGQALLLAAFNLLIFSRTSLFSIT